MKKTLIINGHPNKQSYNYALAEAYRKGAVSNGVQPDQINIADRKRMEHEPDLKNALDKILEADHLVWFFPMWWYGYPALMKGFIDRTFLPGITFEYVEGKPLPRKLLKGKTARIVITADSPGWYNRFFMKRPAINQFKKGTLEFCGVKPVKLTYIAPIRNSKLSFREKWLGKVQKLGEKNS